MDRDRLTKIKDAEVSYKPRKILNSTEVKKLLTDTAKGYMPEPSNCPNCKTSLSRSIQPRMVTQEDGSTIRTLRPYPDGYLSCPCCNTVVNTGTGEVFGKM